MVIAAIGAAAAVAGTVNSIASSGGQSNAISTGQQQANAATGPYLTTGTNALTQEANLTGLNGNDAAANAMSTFESAPGYGYAVSQGLQAVDHGAAADGTLQSGNTIRAEQSLGTNLANQNFNNYYNQLTQIANSGLTAATNQSQTDTSAGQAQSNIIGNQAAGVSTAINSLAKTAGTLTGATGTGSGGNSQTSSGGGQGGSNPGTVMNNGTF